MAYRSRFVMFGYALWAWFVLSIGMMLHVVFVVMFIRFAKKPVHFAANSARWFLTGMFFLTGIRVTITGLSHLFDHHPTLIISNHCSHLDILSYIQILPKTVTFVAKKELFKIPFLGQELRYQDHLCIDRLQPRQSLKTLQKIPHCLQDQRSVIVFPEGTRSKTGQLQPFHRSVFSIAAKENLTIIPMAISGTQAIIPKQSFWIRPGYITIIIGEPIKTKALSSTQLMTTTHECVQNLLKQCR